MKKSLLLVVLIALILPITVSAANPKPLKIGDKNANVRELQKSLRLIGSPVVPEGQETEYYGRSTEAAVMDLQCKYLSLCSGSASSNGYGSVGPRTYALIQNLKARNIGAVAKNGQAGDKSSGQQVGLRAVKNSPASCSMLGSKDLAVHMRTQVAGRVAASGNSTTAVNLWSEMATTLEGSWKRNPNAWTAKGDAPLDFSGVSPFNSHPSNGYPYRQAGTLISPRHIVVASHYPVQVGAKLVFVSPDNASYVRILTAVKAIGHDITIGVLDSDVPADIAFYPVIPTSIFGKIYKTDQANQAFDIISLDKNDRALLNTFDGIKLITNQGQIKIDSTGNLFLHGKSASSLSGAMSDGDSGHPNFAVISNQLVLLGLHTEAGSGYLLGRYANEINSAMSELGGGYQLMQYDLNCFETFAINHAPQFGKLTGYYDQYVSSSGASTIYDDSGYTVLPAGIVTSPSKPFIKFNPTDVDGNKVAISITDPSNLLTMDAATGAIYFKDTVRALGRKIPGALDVDTYEFTVTITDNGNPPTSQTIRDSFMIKNVPGISNAVATPAAPATPVAPVVPVVPAPVAVQQQNAAPAAVAVQTPTQTVAQTPPVSSPAPTDTNGGYVTLMSPNNGGSYKVGDTVTVTWRTNFLSADHVATIAVFKNGRHFTNIGTRVPITNGTINWTIPAGSYEAGDIYKFYIGVSTGTGTKLDYSDAAFSISGGNPGGASVFSIFKSLFGR